MNKFKKTNTYLLEKVGVLKILDNFETKYDNFKVLFVKVSAPIKLL